MNPFPVARDIFERVLMTFLAALVAGAVADGVGWTDWGNWGNWKTWGASALVAAFTLLKSLVATQIGKMRGRATSASLDPAVKLQPANGTTTTEL